MSFLNDHSLMVLRVAAINTRTQRIERMLSAMATREEESWNKFNQDLTDLVDGYTSVKAENKVLKDQLANTNASTQKAVEDALAADSDIDADKVDAADAVVHAGLTPPDAPVPADPPPTTTPVADPANPTTPVGSVPTDTVSQG